MMMIINTIVEIRAELEISKPLFFVQIYLKCMKKFAPKKMEIRNYKYFKSEAGGYKEVIFSVNGNDIYSYLKYESGVHRVQRIPETETQEEYTPLLQL